MHHVPPPNMQWYEHRFENERGLTALNIADWKWQSGNVRTRGFFKSIPARKEKFLFWDGGWHDARDYQARAIAVILDFSRLLENLVDTVGNRYPDARRWLIRTAHSMFKHSGFQLPESKFSRLIKALRAADSSSKHSSRRDVLKSLYKDIREHMYRYDKGSYRFTIAICNPAKRPEDGCRGCENSFVMVRENRTVALFGVKITVANIHGEKEVEAEC